jgi:hypothetical protein
MKCSRVGMLKRLVIAGAAFVFPLAVSAQGFADRVRQGVNQTASQSGLDKAPDLPKIIGNIINIALSFIGVVMLCYFLYAGFLYLTSAGSKDKVESAKKIMMSTIIGLLIVVASYAISNFVLQQIVNNVVQSG